MKKVDNVVTDEHTMLLVGATGDPRGPSLDGLDVAQLLSNSHPPLLPHFPIFLRLPSLPNPQDVIFSC